MAYPLLTELQAQSAINSTNAIIEDRYERIDSGMTDMDDCFVSHWGNGEMIRHAHFCLSAWELGRSNGFDAPCGSFSTLMCGEVEVPAKMISTQFGVTWIVTSDEWAVRLGRKFIPVGGRSRIQKQLGLHEESIVKPCKPFVVVSCSGMLMPMHFSLVPAESAGN